MNVLSLFDGMSCSQIALNRAGIKYDKYYSSEIDKYSIQITQNNYPKTIQLGDVTKIDCLQLPKIDLLIAGSPCQGFSFCGKQLNFKDSRSVLFFEFEKILKKIKPTYFLLENVCMNKQSKKIITDKLQVQPIKINSNLVSAQNRQRLYWTNIKNIKQPNNKNIKLIDIFENKTTEKIYKPPYYKKVIGKKYIGYVGKSPKQATKVYDVYDKSVCLLSNGGGQGGKTGLYEIPNSLTCRKLTTTECEMLQNVPKDYTKGVSNTQRYKMLGNSFTVDVIVHILKNIGEYNE